ncbi:MAG TPA: FAD-binding oxidoreductase [Xanthobacteraceae bacterium]|nr:FAD-binding oxidoreductase [Xanthobacteraceae bacterium]
MKNVSRRHVLKGMGAAVAVPMLSGAARSGQVTAEQRTIINDASQLNPTPVYRHWVVKPDQDALFIERLRGELKEAAAEKRPVAIAAARHTMGGQSIPKNGTAITVENIRCEPNTAGTSFLVNAGTRWHQVISTLDPLGFSPAVMQSNSDFGVASTFCVNAHGWPVPYGPFGSTVRAIKLMVADGTILDCSRTQNPELFSLAMGGYGLLGIILEVEAEMTENLLLRPKFELMPADDFAHRFLSVIDSDPNVRMAYGRFNVERRTFFKEALMITYRPEPKPKEGLPKADRGGLLSAVSRKVYRAQVGSETGKHLRWMAETVAGPHASSGIGTRNSFMNEPVSNLASPDRRRTDILHEYFVPPERFGEFLIACREIIPARKAEFLNVTLRYVAADDTSILAFAPTRRIAAVMSFSQEFSPEAEAEMLQMTQALIERVIAIGGSFYLPYRLHARRDQVERVYVKAAHFVDLKLRYDPGRLFRNAMWDTYFAPSKT